MGQFWTWEMGKDQEVSSLQVKGPGCRHVLFVYNFLGGYSSLNEVVDGLGLYVR